MILNRHIPSNEVLKSELLKNEAFILSHGSLDITIKDNDAIDMLTGDIYLPNIMISLIEPTPQGALTFGKNGMIYKDDFAKDIWEYIEGMLSNIKSINHGNLGGFYLPVNYLSLEYMYDALKTEETLQQFQSHMPHLDSFSFLFHELNDIMKVYLDFKDPKNNKLWPL